MATAAGARLESERRFYSWMAAMTIALMVIGFGPSFFLRGIVPAFPRPNPMLSPLVIFHGTIFAIWMLIFLAQVRLVSANRRDLHMKLGVLGMALAVALVPLMYLVAVGQVERANQPPYVTPLGWTAIPLVSIPVFVILIWQGWKNRYDAQAHKRLMLSAALLFMWPAVGRFPVAPPSLTGHVISHILCWAVFIPLIVWDLRTRGRLHWATMLGAGLTAGAMILSSLLMLWPIWERIADGLPGT